MLSQYHGPTLGCIVQVWQLRKGEKESIENDEAEQGAESGDPGLGVC